MAEFYMGLDLGQSADYTAISVVERKAVPQKDAEYHLRHLERPKLGTSYPAIVARVKELLARDPLKGNASLVVDATGVGAPVVDMLRRADLGAPIAAVTITGGTGVTQGDRGDWGVPKRDLVSNLVVLYESGRMKVAGKMPEAQLLVKELLSFQVKITLDAHDTYGAWREGAHDDLVLSVALAAWYAERVPGLPFGWARAALGEPRESVRWPDGTVTEVTR